MARIGTSDLEVYPLCLGGNVFGWTADEGASVAILDAFVANGGNFIDTADSYMAKIAGLSGGESESILGRWMSARGNREDVVVATKVGKMPGLTTLDRPTIRRACEESLRRLQTDYIDVYYCHRDDPETSLLETLEAMAELIDEGKVRCIAASNYSTDRLAAALAVSAEHDLPRFVAVQPHYNLLVRKEYEGSLAHLCEREGLRCLPYYALASGFLTGKYRSTDITGQRAPKALEHLNPRGLAILDVVEDVAAEHGVAAATIAIAWLQAQPTVAAPIASVSRVEQLPALMAAASITLTTDQLARLDTVSA